MSIQCTKINMYDNDSIKEGRARFYTLFKLVRILTRLLNVEILNIILKRTTKTIT